MARRDRTVKVQPRAQLHAAPQGSPRGMTFWHTMQECWRKFLLRYILGLTPYKTPEFFVLGGVYHALHEGVPENDIAAWGNEWAEALPTAKKLYERRIDAERNPPLPKAHRKEQTYTVPVPGTMGVTTKPDWEELDGAGHPTPRDFKTAAFFRKNDPEHWDTSPQMLAEILALGATSATVDIIHKGDDGGNETPSFGKVQQLEVKLDERKKQSFYELIQDLQRQLDQRLDLASRAARSNALHLAASAFPRSHQCVTQYGLCPYYDRCWTDGAAKYLFKKIDGVEQGRFRWAEGDDSDAMKVRIARAKRIHDALVKEL